MDKLKQLVASKRKTNEDEFGGKKFVKRADLEEAKLQKLREEEEAEKKLKVWLICITR
jgi:pre-mRNA-splicing factor 18